jgi:hypothetical protein
MAEHKIALFRERGVPLQVALATAALVNKDFGPIRVEVRQTEVDLGAAPAQGFSWAHVFGALTDIARVEDLAGDTFVHLLMSSTNAPNWFAVENPSRMRQSFGHLGDFTWATTAPAEVIAAHYVCKAAVNALVTESGRDWKTFWHMEPRGCFFDFCGTKSEITWKLRTGDMCEECVAALEKAGLGRDLLTQLVQVMDRSRRPALGAARYLPAGQSAETMLPFPVAVTRHKAIHAISRAHRLLALINHVDAMVRYTAIATWVQEGHHQVIPDTPSLGWWVDRLADLPAFAEATAVLRAERVVRLRNELVGHGWAPREESAYAPDIARLDGVVERLERLLHPSLSSHILFVPRSLPLGGGVQRAIGDLLAGSNALHPTHAVTLDGSPASVGLTDLGRVYLVPRDEHRFLDASRYIVARKCPECGHEAVLLADGAQYIDVFAGHRTTLRDEGRQSR